ncbi:hypothetical protein E2C01_019711 [Portunus trituberculatus]|uniref:Uncharacterized protein n=1 Tax=Portunus trituberculatus TaxID=210409 RepID=A0A5B7DYP2_PORTR|nr:hypothetical protein [Portunus trituberculatus]
MLTRSSEDSHCYTRSKIEFCGTEASIGVWPGCTQSPPLSESGLAGGLRIASATVRDAEASSPF